jgi:hypothetical protein
MQTSESNVSSLERTQTFEDFYGIAACSMKVLIFYLLAQTIFFFADRKVNFSVISLICLDQINGHEIERGSKIMDSITNNGANVWIRVINTVMYPP